MKTNKTYDISFIAKYFGGELKTYYRYGIDKYELKYYIDKYATTQILNAYATSENDYNSVEIKDTYY